MDNMNKGIKFDFSKTEVITNKLRWIKTLKEVFCISLRDAKDAVDCLDVIKFVWKKNESNSNSQNIQEITPNVVKVGSVYILTEEEYNHLCKCRGLLMDMLGTYKQFLQAYESFK